MVTREEALEYHARGKKGKIEVVATKPCATQKDLSLAYTPGVAEPCRLIEKNPEDIYNYTDKGNLVAVISNGTAVLGLGDIGAGAGKPVMEGKGVLFKRFADIDVFDIELGTHDPDEIIKAVKLMEPTFGGINLEDIKAPECFIIEEALKGCMDIPVFHDDQHGTAIISGAGFLNALELAGKNIKEVKVVFSGAGASGIACAKYYLSLGVRKENLILCDSKGPIYKGRTGGMNRYKEDFAVDTSARTLAEALEGADAFVGVSVAGLVTRDMVKSMADRPIIFALANPDPEIMYDDAKAARSDVIVATGRSDFPNQVNNVLGFPFIFRGALDVRARAITEEMKIAATMALANLAKESVPASVMTAYGAEHLEFGTEYMIPKPFDHRVLLWVAPAVARAAMECGVARREIDLSKYVEELERRLGPAKGIMRHMINKAKKEPKRIVYPEGDHETILKACEIVMAEGMARPILLGDHEAIEQRMEELRINLHGSVDIIDPHTSDSFDNYAAEYYRMRHRKGLGKREAGMLMKNRNYFGSMMVHMEDADGLVSGVSQRYPETIRPALQVVGMRRDARRVAGLYMMIVRNDIYFFADATVNIEPTAEDLAEIAIQSANEVRKFDIEPRVAMISFSNFGSVCHPLSEKVKRAAGLVKQMAPDLVVDGEMQADTAVVPEILDGNFSFSSLAGKGGANVLVFPDLSTGNVAYKLVQRLGEAKAVGPILMGMAKPVHVLQIGTSDETDVVHMTAMAVVDASTRQP